MYSGRRGSGSPSPSVVRTSRRGRTVRGSAQQQHTPARKKPFTAVRRTLRTPRRQPGPKQFALPERTNDIQAAVRASEITAPRFFRDQELVWCAIPYPIPATSGGPEATIKLWPAMIEENQLKVSAVIDPALIEADEETKWAIQHRTVYKARLLGSNRQITITDKEALPYLSYAPPEELLQAARDELHNLANSFHDEDKGPGQLEGLYDFDPTAQNPLAPVETERYRKAIVPFTLGVQIASHIAQFWTPTGEWEYKFVIPPAQPRSSASAPLSDILSATWASNAQHKSSQPPCPPLSQPSRPNYTGDSGLSAEELRTVASELLGSDGTAMNTIALTVTQTRFQGMWWGAERIWTGELVRLKMARNQFAPHGAPQVYPPSKASASFIEADQVMHGLPGDPDILSSSSRGLFMKLEGIFLVDTQTPDGEVLKECRANGMLYELADSDWEELLPGSDSIPDVKGKGKGRAHDVGAGSLSPGDLVSGPRPSVAPGSQNGSTSMQSQTVNPPPRELHPKDRSQLSRPILAGMAALPPPPKGYQFRPIVSEGHEVVISVSLISGRYYPGLLDHPLLDNILPRSLENPNVSLTENRHLWAMECIMPGAFQSMDPSDWRPSREDMLRDATQTSEKYFSDKWSEMSGKGLGVQPGGQNQHVLGDDPDGEGEMEVDELWEESASMVAS